MIPLEKLKTTAAAANQPPSTAGAEAATGHAPPRARRRARRRRRGSRAGAATPPWSPSAPLISRKPPGVPENAPPPPPPVEVPPVWPVDAAEAVVAERQADSALLSLVRADVRPVDGRRQLDRRDPGARHGDQHDRRRAAEVSDAHAPRTPREERGRRARCRARRSPPRASSSRRRARRATAADEERAQPRRLDRARAGVGRARRAGARTARPGCCRG